jgi:hypothetical protein
MTEWLRGLRGWECLKLRKMPGQKPRALMNACMSIAPCVQLAENVKTQRCNDDFLLDCGYVGVPQLRYALAASQIQEVGSTVVREARLESARFCLK